MCICIHIHKRTYSGMYTYIFIYVHMCICIRLSIHTYIHIVFYLFTPKPLIRTQTHTIGGFELPAYVYNHKTRQLSTYSQRPFAGRNRQITRKDSKIRCACFFPFFQVWISDLHIWRRFENQVRMFLYSFWNRKIYSQICLLFLRQPFGSLLELCYNGEIQVPRIIDTGHQQHHTEMAGGWVAWTQNSFSLNVCWPRDGEKLASRQPRNNDHFCSAEITFFVKCFVELSNCFFIMM